MRVWAPDPIFGPLPTMPHFQNCLANCLVAYDPIGEPLLEGHLGQQLQAPRRTLLRKVPWALVGQLQQGLSLFFSEDPVWIFRTRLLALEALSSLLIEVMDGVSNRLCRTAEVSGNLCRALPASRKTHDLSAAQSKGLF